MIIVYSKRSTHFWGLQYGKAAIVRCKRKLIIHSWTPERWLGEVDCCSSWRVKDHDSDENSKGSGCGAVMMSKVEK